MNIIANSIFVDNQEEALQFYTDILGFEKKIDEPVGEGFRWLTLVSPNQPDGAQLILEPNGNPIASDYQQRLFVANIPITMFGVENVQQTYDALTQKGVHFTVEPTTMGSAKMGFCCKVKNHVIFILKNEK